MDQSTATFTTTLKTSLGASHWMQLVQPVDRPRPVAADEVMVVEASHDRRHVYLSV